ncbi:MAG: heavy-metal-associated domain-containing protein [Winogradskyella sp.]
MTTTLHIDNLKGCGCKNSIIEHLINVKNISDVDVDYKTQTVTFNYHTKHDFENAKHVLSRIGYPVIGADNKLRY